VGNPEQPLWTFRMTGGLAARLAPLSLVLFAVAIAVYALIARQTLNSAQINVLVILIPVAVLLVHEALHGVGFLIFGGRPKFGAGIKGGAPYLFATCPGRRFSWGRFLVIGALPLVVIDLAALALAGYSPLVVPAMLAFAFNTAGAVGDLWMIAVILQTPRTAQFEDTDEPAIIAWPGPGTIPPKRLPRGLDPRGGETVVFTVSLAAVLLAACFLVVGIAEVVLARASPHGILAVSSLELATISTTGGHTSGSADLSAQTLLAALLAAPLTWAARRRSRHKS
jgi:Putative zincin peptidase